MRIGRCVQLHPLLQKMTTNVAHCKYPDGQSKGQEMVQEKTIRYHAGFSAQSDSDKCLPLVNAQGMLERGTCHVGMRVALHALPSTVSLARTPFFRAGLQNGCQRLSRSLNLPAPAIHVLRLLPQVGPLLTLCFVCSLVIDLILLHPNPRP